MLESSHGPQFLQPVYQRDSSGLIRAAVQHHWYRDRADLAQRCEQLRSELEALSATLAGEEAQAAGLRQELAAPVMLAPTDLHPSPAALPGVRLSASSAQRCAAKFYMNLTCKYFWVTLLGRSARSICLVLPSILQPS